MVGLEVGAAPNVLDGMTELMVYSNYPQAKNIMLFGFDVEGEVDIGAANSALLDVVEIFPEFASSVKEARVGGKRCLVWAKDPDFIPQFQSSTLKLDRSTPFQHVLLRHLSQSLEKDWDLLRTVPTEFHVIRHDNGRSTLLTLVHHAAADGWTLSTFYREFMARYHENVTGEGPQWPGDPDIKTQMIQLKRSTWRDAFFFTKNLINRYMNQAVLPQGTADREEVGVHYVKSVLEQEESSRVFANAARFRGSFIDTLAGAISTAVDKWNTSLNIPPGELVVCVTVQMRGRYGPIRAGSNSSSIVIRTLPDDRKDAEHFSRSVADRRKEQFVNLMDVRTSEAACSLADTIRAFPLSVRQRVAHFVCQMPLIPILIAPFGSMWPEVGEGRRTGDSYLKKAGGLDLVEFHTIPYKLGYRCPLVFGIYTFRKRINLQLMASACHFTWVEAERFVNEVRNVLVEGPFG